MYRRDGSATALKQSDVVEARAITDNNMPIWECVKRNPVAPRIRRDGRFQLPVPSSQFPVSSFKSRGDGGDEAEEAEGAERRIFHRENRRHGATENPKGGYQNEKSCVFKIVLLPLSVSPCLPFEIRSLRPLPRLDSAASAPSRSQLPVPGLQLSSFKTRGDGGDEIEEAEGRSPFLPSRGLEATHTRAGPQSHAQR